MLRFRFLVPLFALCALVTVAVAVSAAAAAPQAKKPPAKVVKISVTMHDFFFTISRNSVPKGSKVIFTVTNRGQTDHDFVLATQNKHTPVIPEGTKTTLTVSFPKAGKFLYLCSVGEHFLHGMKGYLVVK